MMAFLAGWGFLWPAGLLLFPLIMAVMLWAYLKRGSTKPLPVATLFLLRNLKSADSAKRKISLPWRFFLELALLALLLLGAIGLYGDQEASRYAFVLDNSLSMSLTDSSDPLGQSLLDIAKRDLLMYLEELPSGASVELFISSPQFMPLSKQPLSTKEAGRLLETIEIMPGSDDLEAPLRSLHNRTQFKKITVFTDKMFKNRIDSTDNQIELQTAQPLSGRSLAQNIAISDVLLTTDKASGTAKGVKIIASSFLRSALDVPFTLYGWHRNQLELGPQLIAKKTVSLGAVGSHAVTFPITTSQWDAFKVMIEPEPGSPANLADWIKLDNAVWFVPRRLGSEVIVVSALSKEQLGLAAVPYLKVREMNLAQIATINSVINSGSVVILHRVVPNFVPPVNFLLVQPEIDSQWAAITKRAAAGSIASWNQSHPIMSYLNVPLLALKSSSTLKGKLGSQELINTTKGVVALAHQELNQRYAVFGFEIFPFNGKDSPFLSILTLNTLKWLKGDALATGYQGVMAREQKANETKQRDKIDGAVHQQLATAEGGFEILSPGLYLEDNSGKGAELLAVNYFNLTESNVTRTANLSFPSVPTYETKAKNHDERKYYYVFLATLVLVIMALDRIVTNILKYWPRRA